MKHPFLFTLFMANSGSMPRWHVKELETLPESTVTPMVASWKRQYLRHKNAKLLHDLPKKMDYKIGNIR